eukprot:gene10849-2925_t
MAAFLNTFLGLPEKATSMDENVCIVSEGGVDGSVFLHHFMQMYSRATPVFLAYCLELELTSTVTDGGTIVLLSFAQTFNHYSVIAKKMGYNLRTTDSPNALFLDGLTNLTNTTIDTFWGENPEHPCITNLMHDTDSAIDVVTRFLSKLPNHKRTLFVVDGVVEALAAGVSNRNMMHLLHRLRILAHKHSDGSSIVYHYHRDGLPESSDDAILSTQLPFLADTIITASNLPTGVSNTVHGAVIFELETQDLPL